MLIIYADSIGNAAVIAYKRRFPLGGIVYGAEEKPRLKTAYSAIKGGYLPFGWLRMNAIQCDMFSGNSNKVAVIDESGVHGDAEEYIDIEGWQEIVEDSEAVGL